MQTKICLLWLVFLAACSAGKETSEQGLEGAWRMVSYSYYNTDNEAAPKVYLIKDSIEQVKVFHEGSYMWIRRCYDGTPEKFGFGKYEIKDGVLFESMEMNSLSMDKFQLESGTEYHFDFEVTGTSYRQYAADMNGVKIYSEDYERISR